MNPSNAEIVKILIVDDEPLLGKYMGASLSQFGFQTVSVTSGKEALEYLYTKAVDLVLLDWMMPDKSGLEVIRTIRARYSRIQLPVIMVTSRASSQDLALALKAGANDFIAKPFDVTVAKARIDTQLSLKRTAVSRLGFDGRGFKDQNGQNLRDHLFSVVQMKSEINDALENDQFSLVYQPIFCLKTGNLVGMESLMRWQHPKFGVLNPGMFLNPAEITGMLNEVENWSLVQSCRQIREWLDKGLDPKNVAVNFSGKQFKDKSLVKNTAAVIKHFDLPPKYLKIEITEQFFCDDLNQTAHVINHLRSLGIQVALDDFGTGFSSLSHLKDFPIDSLKIDQTFVKNIKDDTTSATIVKAILGMAESLGISTVCEGIESREQFEILKQTTCDMAQGYLFSIPLPAEEYAKKYLTPGKICRIQMGDMEQGVGMPET